jgi:hypothetical protein
MLPRDGPFIPREPDAIDRGVTLTDAATVCLVKRGGRVRPEIAGTHAHPMLVVCSAEAAKKGKRARLCGCPECFAAMDFSR